MSRNIRSALSLGFLFVLALASPAAAQQYVPFGPVWDEFGHDFAIFSPAEISPFDGGPDPKEGIFLEWHRMYVDVNRSSGVFGPTQGDWTWGNIYTGGYMVPDDTNCGWLDAYGWLAEYVHVDGPNNGRRFDSPLLPDDLRPEENNGKYNSIEFSKMWRFKPLHEGSIVEAFAGPKFARFEQWTAFNIDTPVGHFDTMSTKNDMYGGQVGLRWYKMKGRWILSAEGRYFYAYNHQNFAASGSTINDDTAVGQEFSEDNWVSAGDLRIQADYQLTKSFALSIGWDMIYFGHGVARGAPPFDDQDLLITGVIFGLNVNR
jgi:hypothetical protein